MLNKIKYKLPEGFELHVADPDIYNKKRQDSAFYTTGQGWTIANVSYKDEEFSVVVCGEMKISLPNGSIARDVWDLKNAGITTDKQLSKLDPEAWHMNSWFEIWDEKDNECWDSWIAHTVKDGIEMCIGAIQMKLENPDD